MKPGKSPRVGDIVHYVSFGTPVRPDGTQAFTSECRAAMITEVSTNDGVVNLVVFNPSGTFFNLADYDQWDGGKALAGAIPKGGSWHWPERAI